MIAAHALSNALGIVMVTLAMPTYVYVIPVSCGLYCRHDCWRPRPQIVHYHLASSQRVLLLHVATHSYAPSHSMFPSTIYMRRLFNVHIYSEAGLTQHYVIRSLACCQGYCRLATLPCALKMVKHVEWQHPELVYSVLHSMKPCGAR